jgi:hypothetical protein
MTSCDCRRLQLWCHDAVHMTFGCLKLAVASNCALKSNSVMRLATATVETSSDYC